VVVKDIRRPGVTSKRDTSLTLLHSQNECYKGEKRGCDVSGENTTSKTWKWRRGLIKWSRVLESEGSELSIEHGALSYPYFSAEKKSVHGAGTQTNGNKTMRFCINKVLLYDNSYHEFLGQLLATLDTRRLHIREERKNQEKKKKKK